AKVAEVAQVIRQLYADKMNQNPTLSNQGGFRTALFTAVSAGANRNTDSYGNPRAVTLSIAEDTRGNVLHLLCPETLYTEIKLVVDRMEKSAEGAVGSVQFVPLRGVDPPQVQSAIESM